MVTDEITYFAGQGVEVTNTRFTVSDTTYSISYIKAVETTIEDKSTVKLKPASIIIGVILLLIGILSIFAAMSAEEPPLIILITLFGIASAFIGLVLFSRSYVTRKFSINHLYLTTMVDKYDAFQSEDIDLFRSVEEALHIAVENRDFT